MNRNWIALGTFALTGAACAAFYFTRSQRIAGIESEIARTRASLVKLEAPAGTSITGRATDSQTPAAVKLSVPQAADKALAIAAAFGEGKVSGTDYLKAMAELLGHIGDYTPEQLLDLADAMDAPLSGKNPGMLSRMKQGLLLLAAEQASEALLARPEIAESMEFDLPALLVRMLPARPGPETGESMELAPQILGTLARKNPAAALNWLDGSGLDDTQRDILLRHIVRSAFRADFREGLRLATERGLAGDGLGPLGVTIPLQQDQIAQAAGVLSEPQSAAQRTAILGMVLNSAAFYSGVEGIQEITRQHGIPEAEIAGFLTTHAGRRTLDGLDPAQAIPWMAKILTEVQQRTAVPDLVKSWARRDFNAAGTWLRDMPASETRDLSVASFAATVTPLDPQAAAVWSLEISDAARRQTTLAKVVEQWRRTDAPGADAWLQAKGLEAAPPILIPQNPLIK